MKPSLPARLRTAALSIFLFGLVAGALIYALADDAPEASSYVVAGGQVFAVDPADNRAYRRELQRFGGKASLVFDDLLRWLESRWRGRTLGATVAWLGAFAALGLWLFARYLDEPPEG